MMMNAQEAEAASRELKYPLGRSIKESQPGVDAYHARLNEIISAFRAGLEAKYSAHLSFAEQELIWKEARAAAPSMTWVETEETYQKIASQR
jgi:hypothetical protein